MKNKFILCVIYLSLSGCCGMTDFLNTKELCADQIFTETRQVTIKSSYSVDENKIWLIANKITGSDVKKALQIPTQAHTLKSVSVTSAKINYTRASENSSASFYLNLGAIASDGSFDLLLLKQQNQVLPLFDIPEVPLITKAVNINEYLNGKAISELNKALARYITVADVADISFIMTGEPFPKNSRTKFNLDFTLNVTAVYEICRYVPLGQGERVCE